MMGKGNGYYLDKTLLYDTFQCENYALANHLMDILETERQVSGKISIEVAKDADH